MKLHELSPAAGSVTPAWRKGRGPGSGNGISPMKWFEVLGTAAGRDFKESEQISL